MINGYIGYTVGNRCFYLREDFEDDFISFDLDAKKSGLTPTQRAMVLGQVNTSLEAMLSRYNSSTDYTTNHLVLTDSQVKAGKLFIKDRGKLRVAEHTLNPE